MPENIAVLKVLTTEPEPLPGLVTLDNTLECRDTLTCPCLGCEMDRRRAMRRGVRPSSPIPFKRKSAA